MNLAGVGGKGLQATVIRVHCMRFLKNSSDSFMIQSWTGPSRMVYGSPWLFFMPSFLLKA